MTRSEAVMFDGHAGKLEGLLDLPAEAKLRTIAVVCHPHPQHEGSMTNKVTHTLARAFVDAGAAALRFNFRGVGRSEGRYDNAVGEIDDALTAVKWLQERYPQKPLWLGGFSFGGYVALRAASRTNPSFLVTVAPAVTRFESTDIELPQCPWLLIQGSVDDVVPHKSVLAWIERLPRQPRLRVLPNVGHFFHGSLTTLRQIIGEEISRLIDLK